jgi:hypothetical protein
VGSPFSKQGEGVPQGISDVFEALPLGPSDNVSNFLFGRLHVRSSRHDLDRGYSM